MKPTRRQLGMSLAAAALGAACSSGADDGVDQDPGDDGGGPSWEPGGAVDAAAFAWGVQVGDAVAEGAVVSVRSTEASLTLQVARAVDGGWEQVSVLEDLASVEGVVQHTLDGLEPDTDHAVVAIAPDGERRSDVSRFRTALPEGGRRVVRFGATSCLGGNEPWPSLSHAAAERLDFFLLLGDTIYADNGPNAFDFEKLWGDALATQGLRDLAASTSLVATWDDHEVDNNWSWSTHADLAEEALVAFRKSLPQRVGPGGTGIWRSLSWGDTLEILVLDSRGERTGGNYLSPEQLTWLKGRLSASTARFKIVMTSVPITDFSGTIIGAVGQDDRWQGFPEQRTELLEHVAAGIEGVVWVSGDIHVGGIFQVDPPGGAAEAAVDVVVGPGGSFINPVTLVLERGGRILELVKVHHYALFEADPDAGTLTVAFIGDDGEVLAERTLQL